MESREEQDRGPRDKREVVPREDYDWERSVAVILGVHACLWEGRANFCVCQAWRGLALRGSGQLLMLKISEPAGSIWKG